MKGRCWGMNYSTAIKIIRNIHDHTEEEIRAAVLKILEMETINAVTKDDLLNVVRYLFFACYDVEKGGDTDAREVH